MKLALEKCVNGNFTIVSEHGENVQAAKVAFHNECRILWNAIDVITGTVAIVDEQMDVFEDYKEQIFHEPAPAAEPAEE